MTNILLQIPCWIQWWKNFKNRPTFSKVINKKCCWSFFDSHCTSMTSLSLSPCQKHAHL